MSTYLILSYTMINRMSSSSSVVSNHFPTLIAVVWKVRVAQHT